MSHQQDYQQQAAGIFSFTNGFERSTVTHQQAQIRRDNNKGFDAPPPPLVGIDEEEEQAGGAAGGGGLPHVYETAGMLSEMFNFPATELLEQQHHHFRTPSSSRPQPPENWYGSRQGMIATTTTGFGGDSKQQISGINADSAAAMHLFLMNPAQRRSPSPPPSATSSTLHMLLPNHSSNSLQGFPPPPPPAGSAGGSFGQFTWVPDSGAGHEGAANNPAGPGPGHHEMNVVEGQGLSLSLSSSLQHLEAAKAEELRMGEGGFLFYNQGGGAAGPNSGHYPYKNHLQGGMVGQGHLAGFASASSSSSLGVVHVLRNSKYVKAAQELLEEFCSVGRGHFKKNKFSRQNSNPNSTASPSSSKDPPPPAPPPPLSASDRIEHQRRKVKLLSMLDEVDRRYNHYCEQMQMVVNSFDVVMGYGAAVPYTALAQKAMSRHFRCLKDAITAQLKHSCEVLGEKEGAGGSGLTKGETPRLKMLEQSLRQQRAFQQMGMMEQEAWRPQRGLPERSVNILRAWLFEHFLHPWWLRLEVIGAGSRLTQQYRERWKFGGLFSPSSSRLGSIIRNSLIK